MAKRAVRPIRIVGNETFITLTQGKVAVIDAADVPLVEGRNWHAIKGRYTFYGASRIGGKAVLLHRRLTGGKSAETDHHDGDGLNCRRRNIRPATSSQNRCNSKLLSSNIHGLKGVSPNHRGSKWGARIQIQRKIHYLGSFDTKELAHAAYCEASKRLHGEFGRTA